MPKILTPSKSPDAASLPDEAAPGLGGYIPLALQLALLAVLPALLVSAGLLAHTTLRYLESAQAHALSQAQAVAQQLAAVAQNPLADEDRRALLRIAQSGIAQPHIQQVQIWSGAGELLAAQEATDTARQPGLQASAPIVASAGASLGQVTVDYALDELRALQRETWGRVWATAAICVLGVLFTGMAAARSISAPIGRLARAVDRLGGGQPARVAVGGALEVRRLQRGFNAAAQALHEHRELLAERIREATAELARKNELLEQTSQAKTRLLAAASHDLRQPLRALTLFSEGLASGETHPGRLQRIGHIRQSIQLLDRLFVELLDLSQIDAGAVQPRWCDFPLERLWGDLRRDFTPIAERQCLRLRVRSSRAWVHCDYVMLLRILGNLLTNALRNTLAGGVLVGARQRGELIQIDVIDTGIGMAPEFQQRVFNEFFQIEPPPGLSGERGTGLGLPTAQRLATLLGTRVELASTLGKGTRMRIMVRMAPAGADAQECPEPSEDEPVFAHLPR